MPTRRCCCAENPCQFGGGCLIHGQAYCAITEAAESYIITVDEGSTLLGNGDLGTENDGLCCSEMWNFRLETPPAVLVWPESTYSCNYEDEVEDACGRLVLTINSATSVTVTLTLSGGKTVVWKNTTTADPLCPFPVIYSAADSDPPTDCAFWSRLCIYPRGSCCPDVVYPKTLNVTLVESGTCDCDVTTVDNTVDLIEFAPRGDNVFSPALLLGITLAFPFKLKARYRGTLVVGDCGTTGIIELWCYDDYNGTDGIGNTVWRFLWEQMGPDPCLSGDVIGAEELPEPDVTCDPFMLTFGGITDLNGCCPDGGSILTVIFSE